uniref:Uncharacterized protein n=1 Tax=Picea sitchensis TaxID=3332 RepID=A9NXD0_PICSI|nr:unknown [Picea sitchensis]ACN41205.1 unknown [Picea sitchensis]
MSGEVSHRKPRILHSIRYIRAKNSELAAFSATLRFFACGL